MEVNTIEKASVLLAEDDQNFSASLKRILIKEGYEVCCAYDGDMAWQLFQDKEFDICLLDIIMPGIDGFQLGKKIRDGNGHVPILYLSSRGKEVDRLCGFRMGGDDYLNKPFSVEELLYRMKVFLRRSRKFPALKELNGPLYHVGDFIVNEGRQTLTKDGIDGTLTPHELRVLLLLIKNRNKVLKREYILNEVWGNDHFFTGRTLDVYISRLRKRLKSDPHVEIETTKNEGYALKVYDGI